MMVLSELMFFRPKLFQPKTYTILFRIRIYNSLDVKFRSGINGIGQVELMGVHWGIF